MAEPVAVLAGRYRLHDRIGAGGMGEVWRATDDVLGRTVAVKLILPTLLAEPGFVRRFVAEARAMASVRHPGVVAIHDFHGDADGAYLVMEFVDGEPLSRLLGRVGRLAPAVTMDLIRQTAQALQAVHDRGIVHRDIKPANILIRPDGQVALTDFGIAQAADNAGLTASGAILGTPSYLAPEQVMGQAASPRSDVYALGVVGYECLAGRRPFVGDNPFAVAMQRVGQAPPPLDPQIPAAVAGVVDRSLAADPALRWQSAADLAGAAQYAAASLQPRPSWPAPRAGEATTVAVPVANRGLSRPLLLAALALVVLVAAGVGVAIWRAGSPGVPTSAGSGSAGASGPAVTGSAVTGSAGVHSGPPRGYVGCGDSLCPTAPMCWRGLTVIGDVGAPPAPADCATPHYWETFAATTLPADATSDRDLSHLIDRPDVAGFCSPARMAARSTDQARTRGWRIEAWPIPADPYTVLVHCLAGDPEAGETPGAAFRPGA